MRNEPTVATTAIARAADTFARLVDEHPEGVTIAQFRDALTQFDVRAAKVDSQVKIGHCVLHINVEPIR